MRILATILIFNLFLPISSAFSLEPSQRIFVFISSSIPKETLRQYVSDASLLKDPNLSLVMNGFIKGAKEIKPTLNFIASLTIKDSHCNPLKEACASYDPEIVIDPLMFRRYSIKQVPAIVFDEDFQEDKKLEKSKTYQVIYGDASLAYLLGMINKKAKNQQIEKMIRRLEGVN